MNQTSPSPAVPVCVPPEGAGLRRGEDRHLQKRGRGWDPVQLCPPLLSCPEGPAQGSELRQRGRQVRVWAGGQP